MRTWIVGWGVGEIAEWAPQRLDEGGGEVQTGECPHIRVSVSVVKSRGDLQPAVPESRGLLLPGWREGFEGRRGIRSALSVAGSIVDGVVPLRVVLAVPPVSCGWWPI